MSDDEEKNLGFPACEVKRQISRKNPYFFFPIKIRPFHFMRLLGRAKITQSVRRGKIRKLYCSQIPRMQFNARKKSCKYVDCTFF